MLDLSEGSSKLIPINEESNHQIVHLFRLGKAQRTTHVSGILKLCSNGQGELVM